MVSKVIDYAGAIKKPFNNFKETSFIALLAMFFTVSSTTASLVFMNYLPQFEIPTIWLIAGVVGIVIAPISWMFLLGYFLKIAFSKKIPSFKLSYFKEGFFGSLIVLAYFIPISLLLLLIFRSFFSISGAEDIVRLVLLTLATLIVILFWTFITPMALLSYAKKDFKEAFKILKVFKKCFTKKYSIAWLFVIGYSFAIDFSINLIGKSIPGDVGLIILLALTAYGTALTGITGFTIYGRVFNQINSKDKKKSKKKIVKKK